jgi:Zn-dependent M28 family amino/carboxypeptidase
VDPVATAQAAIRPEALRAHVRFLADDLLEGRDTGSPGHEIAARYVAAQFEALGLEPAGNAGSYFQQVPLRLAKVVAERSSLSWSRAGGGALREARLGQEALILPDLLREETEVEGEVVYAGYGIRAAERGYDDYAGIDARGKLVVVLLGSPASFSNHERAFYSSRQLKAETAVAQGAIGMIFVLPPSEEKRFPFARVADMIQAGSMAWVDAQGRPEGATEGLRGRAVLSREGASALFEGAPLTLATVFEEAEASRPKAFALPVRARLKSASRLSSLESPNVLGILRGSDPALARETVVLSAHLDHIGIGREVEGDTIYNGAFDNASGTAGILEIARAFAALPRRPRRSILFAAVTGEEKGLLGAEYLATHPTVEGPGVVANLNMDMFVALFPARDVVAFGAEHSSLGPLAREMAGRLGLELAPDPFPEQVVFVRSDHYAFVRQGVPALMLSSGLTSADPKVDGAALFGAWIGKVYHSPQDDLSQPMDFAAAATIARLYFLIGHRVAEADGRPTWNAGDFFGGRFGR